MPSKVVAPFEVTEPFSGCAAEDCQSQSLVAFLSKWDGNPLLTVAEIHTRLLGDHSLKRLVYKYGELKHWQHLRTAASLSCDHFQDELILDFLLRS